MWVAKFKIWHKNCILRPRCVKYNVTDFVYLINSWSEKKHFYYTELHILQGKEEDKKNFLRDLKKDSTIAQLETEGNHTFTLNKERLEKQYYSPVFNPKIIHIKPVAQRADGFEDWEVACWDKEPLMKIMKVPVFDVELIYVEQRPIGDIFMPHVYPKLSPKQREAIELAVDSGYYEYPRKVNLGKLGKLSGVKRQSFQEALRKAEKKLVPFLTENLE